MIINRCWNCMEELEGKDICPHCGFNPEKDTVLPYALKPNTILHGKYLIGNMLGQGGFGITYIGFDLALEMKVAIKEYFPFNMAARNSDKSMALSWNSAEVQETGWRAGCTQFLAEARKMAKVNAIPEIVSVRETFEENRTAYIVMDYVPGTTLKKYVKKNGTFTFHDCVEKLLPLIEGLDKVHRQGIIHRDISPSNLMMTPGGKVFLLDLGAAKDMKRASTPAELVATKGFSPIEQYTSDGRIGPWTDVYAMAASIYYCIFGKPVPAALDRFENDTLEFNGKTKKPLTPEQIKVLKKALAVKQEMRYQSAIEFFIALRDCMGEKKKPVGKIVAGVLGGLAVVGAAAAIALTLMANKPWLPTVEQLGSRGTMVESDFLMIDGVSEFYTDLDQSLVMISYNEEDQTFYVDSGDVIYAQDPEIEGDGVGGLNLADDKVYFTYFRGAGNSDYLISMNHDGTEQEVLTELAYDHSYPQYVKLSDGSEYFYFLMDDGSEEEVYHLHLYRFDPESGTSRKVVDEETFWFALNGKYVYFLVNGEEGESNILKRATLDGEDIEVLDDVHWFWDGFVHEGRLYMVQSSDLKGNVSVGLIQCGEDGKPVDEGKGNFAVDWSNDTWTVGDGWIYYNTPGEDSLYRIRMDGTANSLLCSGYQYQDLTVHNGSLFFKDGYTDADGNFHCTQAHIARDDGTNILSCDREAQDYLTTESGLKYVITNGEVRLISYVGTSQHVIIPNEIDGYPVSENIDTDTFYSEMQVENVHFYKLAHEDELTYIKDANGITITGYTGRVTGDYNNLAIPSYIEGTPVTQIGEEAFAQFTFTRVYLPEELTIVGENAFYKCEDLIYVVFPGTLQEIKRQAFFGCSFDGVDVVLPDGVTYLGTGFMAGCEPNSVFIPKTVESAGRGFMGGCGGRYIVDPDHEMLKSVNGIILSRSGHRLYSFPMDYTGTYTVPSTVKSIAAYAFYQCSVEKVILPEGLTTIEYSAFEDCASLYSINIPRSVQEIGDEAFVGTALTSVVIDWDCVLGTDVFEKKVDVRYYTNN